MSEQPKGMTAAEATVVALRVLGVLSGIGTILLAVVLEWPAAAGLVAAAVGGTVTLFWMGEILEALGRIERRIGKAAAADHGERHEKKVRAAASKSFGDQKEPSTYQL